MRHLLVTNDFPPKVGGIQSYLWELWRRLPPEQVTVLTTPYRGAADFDAAQAFEIRRVRQPAMLPEPWLRHEILRTADDVGAELILLDPALPVGLLGPTLGRPYGVILHGAEVTVPGRIPGTSQLLGAVLRGARLVVAAGGYPLAEARHAARADLPSVVIPPGVDTDRFVPLDGSARSRARTRLGLGDTDLLVVSVSRLVPRKGMDTLIAATGALEDPRVTVAIAGSGRDEPRLRRLAHSRVRFLGRVDDADLPDLYGCADLFAMLCRDRWAGLEQEGFGIVFLEAAAAGVPSIAGRSGGSHEAVEDGVTGLVVEGVEQATAAIARLLDDDALRAEMGAAARARAVADFSYDVLAGRLAAALDGVAAR
jgi:phosphatidylinositol alpha-1,6-mannosyltransferase